MVRKLRIFFVELILVGIFVAWFFGKAPDLIDKVIPWIVVAILWHLTFEVVLERDGIKSGLVSTKTRFGHMAWIAAFLVGGCLSLIYLATAKGIVSEITKRSAPAAPPILTSTAAENHGTTPPAPSPSPPIRRPMVSQADMLLNWIHQATALTHVNELWLSQIFQHQLDNIPAGPEVDVPAALKTLASQGKVEILETATRSYSVWGIESFQEDIRFKITNSHVPLKKQEPAPLLADIRIASQAPDVSTNPDLPYALKAIVQTDRDIELPAFEFECDGEIGDGNVWQGEGPQEYTMHYFGVAPYNKHMYVAAWKTPTFIPGEPLTIMIYSKAPVKLISVRKIKYEWPF
jgi:hypothetical protein